MLSFCLQNGKSAWTGLAQAAARCSGGRGTVLACTASCSAGEVFPGSSLGQPADKAPTKPSTLNMQPD